MDSVFRAFYHPGSASLMRLLDVIVPVLGDALSSAWCAEKSLLPGEDGLDAGARYRA
jgi:hypothetical protein